MEGKTRQLIVYFCSSIIMWRCLFLISLQPSSPSIMPPSGRVHPPACVIWTFRRVSFACGPRPCLYFQCLFVICPTCIQTNSSFKVSLCLHYVSLRILVLTSHSVHAPTHVDEIDWKRTRVGTCEWYSAECTNEACGRMDSTGGRHDWWRRGLERNEK